MLLKLTRGRDAIIDPDMFAYLAQHKWHLSPNSKNNAPYAARSIKYPSGAVVKEYLHWYIIGKPINGFVVDHINGNGLDNRRENLRIVTPRINAQNKATNRNGKVLGAYFDKKVKKWQSKVFIDKKSKTIGWFKTKEAANLAYFAFINSLK
jgi:hypothetical protein